MSIFIQQLLSIAVMVDLSALIKK